MSSIRKEVLCNLLSNGILITSPIFETDDLEAIDDLVEVLLERHEIGEEFVEEYDEEVCPYCGQEVTDFEEDDVDEIDILGMELNGRTEVDTEVIHVLYPALDSYTILTDLTEIIKYTTSTAS